MSFVMGIRSVPPGVILVRNSPDAVTLLICRTSTRQEICQTCARAEQSTKESPERRKVNPPDSPHLSSGTVALKFDIQKASAGGDAELGTV